MDALNSLATSPTMHGYATAYLLTIQLHHCAPSPHPHRSRLPTFHGTECDQAAACVRWRLAAFPRTLSAGEMWPAARSSAKSWRRRGRPSINNLVMQDAARRRRRGRALLLRARSSILLVLGRRIFGDRRIVLANDHHGVIGTAGGLHRHDGVQGLIVFLGDF